MVQKITAIIQARTSKSSNVGSGGGDDGDRLIQEPFFRWGRTEAEKLQTIMPTSA